MKKLITAILTASLVISAAALGVHADENKTIDLIGSGALVHTCGDGIFEVSDGVINAPNENAGDSAIMSEIRINAGEHIKLEATATINSGNAFGLIVGEFDYTMPFTTGWFAINVDLSRGEGTGDSRVLAYGAGVASQTLGGDAANMHDDSMGKGVDMTLTMEILSDGTLLAYYNGVEYTDGVLSDWLYDGGYVGLMTWFGDITFKSATLTYIDDNAPTAEEAPASEEVPISEEAPEAEVPETEEPDVVEEPVVAAEPVAVEPEVAPQTFDAFIIGFLGSVIAFAGCAVSKKH